MAYVMTNVTSVNYPGLGRRGGGRRGGNPRRPRVSILPVLAYGPSVVPLIEYARPEGDPDSFTEQVNAPVPDSDMMTVLDRGYLAFKPNMVHAGTQVGTYILKEASPVDFVPVENPKTWESGLRIPKGSRRLNSPFALNQYRTNRRTWASYLDNVKPKGRIQIAAPGALGAAAVDIAVGGAAVTATAAAAANAGFFSWATSLFSKPQSYFDNLSKVQNALTVLSAEITSIGADTWNRIYNQRLPGAPGGAMNFESATAMASQFLSQDNPWNILLTDKNAPSDENIGRAEGTVANLRAMVQFIKAQAPEVKADADAIGAKTQGEMQNMKLDSPAKVGAEEFERQVKERAGKLGGWALELGTIALIGLGLLALIVVVKK